MTEILLFEFKLYSYAAFVATPLRMTKSERPLRTKKVIPDHPRQARTGVGNDKAVVMSAVAICLQNDVI